MNAPTVGLSVWQIVIAIVIVVAYIAIILSLAWESHQRYGTGYYWVGACIAGAIGAYFHYNYWLKLKIADEEIYPLWAVIAISVFLALIGLWAYLIYFAIMQKLEKRYRAGTRLERRVFSDEQAATGTGRFREQLKGWEGDMKLDMFIVEGKFDQAEDYLNGVLLSSNQERDHQKSRFYEQYRAIIMKERLFFEQSKDFRDVGDKKDQSSSETRKDFDLRQTKEVKQEDLPEGWKLSD